MLIRVVHMYLRYHVLCVSILDRFYRFFGCFYRWILEYFDYSLFHFMFLVVSIIFLSVHCFCFNIKFILRVHRATLLLHNNYLRFTFQMNYVLGIFCADVSEVS